MELLSWSFKSTQPQRIISGLKETFIKRYTAERTNKAELRPQEESDMLWIRQGSVRHARYHSHPLHPACIHPSWKMSCRWTLMSLGWLERLTLWVLHINSIQVQVTTSSTLIMLQLQLKTTMTSQVIIRSLITIVLVMWWLSSTAAMATTAE